MKFKNPLLVILIGSFTGTFNTLIFHRMNSLNNDNK